MSAGRAWAALPWICLLSGCVMPDQMAQYQKDVADVQRALESVSKAQTDLGTRIAALEAGGDVVKRSEIADLRAGQDAILRQVTANADRVEQANARVDRLSQDVQAVRDAQRRQVPVTVAPATSPVTGAETGGSPGAAAAGAAVAGAGLAAGAAAPSAAGAATNPNALYTSAYADFSKGNYALAIQGFQEYAQTYPDTELADNAMYWIGECQFSQGSYRAAVDAFDAMLEKYPKSDKAAAANLKKALAFIQLNQIGQGVEQLRYVTANYPGTDEARIAADRLQALGRP